nr:ribonuclease domain-containing protein [uncultured Schaedlerella sp.]
MNRVLMKHMRMKKWLQYFLVFLLAIMLTGCGSVDKAEISDAPAQSTSDEDSELPEDGTYTSKDEVALYISIYGHLPSNFITKKEAQALGWEGGSLEPYAPGKCIGGSRFGNYEGLLPEKEGRVYTECDIDTLGAEKRGARRIVFSNDGLIYYTEDHYESFELLYGEE